jgi:hypothetical protein
MIEIIAMLLVAAILVASTSLKPIGCAGHWEGEKQGKWVVIPWPAPIRRTRSRRPSAPISRHQKRNPRQTKPV